MFCKVVIHLLDLSIIGKYLSTKYFNHFGGNHPFYDMKKEPHIRRELIVCLCLKLSYRKCFMNACIGRTETIYSMYNHEIDWRRSIRNYVRRNQYLAILTTIKLYHDVVNPFVLLNVCLHITLCAWWRRKPKNLLLFQRSTCLLVVVGPRSMIICIMLLKVISKRNITQKYFLMVVTDDVHSQER